ncbi:hypothetical protein Asi02nite_25160 [Asanoa siamensis]|uniref:Uncharacterized protein n=1 Tax=Asanoa siamensis TaxID=926357 RepID=A0ABQ4CPS7_9ACTN|nr:hypothetical protein Asi02nite_25160 [Asanoa siamensis]
MIRERVSATLLSFVSDQSANVVRVVQLAFALDPDHAHDDLTDRQATLSAEQQYDARTARRRTDEATEILVAAAEAGWAARHAAGSDSGWRVRTLETLLRLDTPTPELYETRTIVATRDLPEIVVRLDLPRPPDGEPDAGEVAVDVLYGARISAVARGNGNRHVAVTLALPGVLPRDREHRLCVHFRVPPGQRIRHRYVIIPLDPCEYGLVKVRFADNRRPASVWRLNGVPPGLLDDPTRRHPRLEIDGVGEVVESFRQLREGRGYGVGWAP